MKTDRELLELAAKAAGIEGDIKHTADDAMWLFHFGVNSPWNPLTDDSDALRLVVKLNLSVTQNDKWIRVQDVSGKEICWMNKSDDPYAATRRAITRAAAQIGETL